MQHHVDDRLERAVEQDLERRLGLGPVRVGDLVRRCCDGAGHGAEVTPGCRAGSRAGYPVSFGRLAVSRPACRLSELVRKKLLRCARSRPKPADITRRWLVIDADGAILGRLSTEIATLLRGKHKPIWAPHVDTGDHVIVVNASKLAIEPAQGD